MSYACRVGHRFSPAELLVGKELAVEQLLWTSLSALDELVIVLDELCHLDEMKASVRDCRHRAENATSLRAALEQIIGHNEPTRLDCSIPVAEPGPPAGRSKG